MLFDVGRLLHEEFLAVYRAATADADGWEDAAVTTAHRVGARLASANVPVAQVVVALRSTDRLLTEAMLDELGDARAPCRRRNRGGRRADGRVLRCR